MKQKEIQKNMVLLLGMILVISSFYLFKFSKNTNFLSYEEYEHLSEINQIKNTNNIILFLEETSFLLNYLVSFSRYPVFFMRILPIFFGILNVFLIKKILDNVLEKEEQKMYTTIFFVFSPFFLYLTLTYNILFLSLFFLFFGTYLLLRDLYFLGFLSFLFSFLFNPAFFLIIILLLIFLYERFKSRNLVFPLISTALVSYFFIRITYASLLRDISLYNLVTYYISDLGSLFGFSIFIFFLGLFGIFFSWKTKKEKALSYFILIFLFICSLYASFIILFITLILSYFAGLAFMKITEREWESTTLKSYVILLIFCGLLFSSGSYLNRILQEGPKNAEIISLEWLKSNVPEGDVFSYHKYGFIINSISRFKTYTDNNYLLYSKDKARILKSEEIFASRNLKNITLFLNDNNLNYIWINQKMKNGEVWEKPEEGMQFVLLNSISFKKIYDYQEVEIWQLLSQN